MAVAIAGCEMGLTAISKSGLADIADRVLTNLASSRAQSILGPTLFSSLFVPSGMADPVAQLSSRELVAVLGTARSTLLGLSTSAGQLDLSNPLSTFYGAAVVSSDPSAVSARVRPGASVAGDATYRFTVSQLAEAQANVGTALTSDAVNGFATGVNTVRITQNGTVTDVSFVVLANDTNATVLTSFADAINATNDPGVGASVHTDAVAGTSQLVLTATTEGTVNAFSLSSVAGTPVADAGVGGTTAAAANASYTQNGVPLSASTNDLYLGSDASLHLTLLSTTTSPVVVTVGADTRALTTAIAALVGSYNTAHGFFASNDDVYPLVARQLGSVASRLGGGLQMIGIAVGSDGALSADATRLSASLGDAFASVQRTIGEASGLAPDLRAIADTFLAKPTTLYPPASPYQPSYGPQQFASQYADRLNALRLQGLLVSALA